MVMLKMLIVLVIMLKLVLMLTTKIEDNDADVEEADDVVKVGDNIKADNNNRKMMIWRAMFL